MKIDLHEITVRDLYEGYRNDAEEGVFGYGGRLNIRPPYQREFIYDDEKRNAVIHSINNGFPLNVMYWVINTDGSFELLDGQQRTISICEYVDGQFSIEGMAFHNLQEDEKEHILNYRLMIYWCEGTPSEILDWFEVINIAGLALTDQEVLNAIYHGPWVTDARRHFSKTGCAAYGLGEKYMTGTPIRQDYLETVIKWINNGDVKGYMSKHQHDTNANPLWLYFQKVINWVEATFTTYRKEMKGQPWGDFYNAFCEQDLDPVKLEKEIATLMMDDEVGNGKNKKGVYAYVLTRDKKYLNLRAFSDSQKREAYEKQKGVCANKKDCPKKGERLDIKEMHADHITPWSKGGKTTPDNCQMLCAPCNRRKGGV